MKKIISRLMIVSTIILIGSGIFLNITNNIGYSRKEKNLKKEKVSSHISNSLSMAYKISLIG